MAFRHHITPSASSKVGGPGCGMDDAHLGPIDTNQTKGRYQTMCATT